MISKDELQNKKERWERYKTIFDLSPEAIGILDINGDILDMNGRVFDWLEYRPEETIGKNFLEVPFLSQESKILAKKNFAKRMAGEQIPPYELNFIKKNGEIVVGRTMGALLFNENRKPIGVIIMISDITAQKEIEKKILNSEEKYRSVIAFSPDPITLTDLQGNIIDCNRATLELHGFSAKKEIIGKNAFSFIAKKDQEKALRNLRKTLKEGFVKNIEYTLVRKNGEEFPAELSASLVRDLAGKPAFFMAITKDISERKKIDQTKTEFVSMASHQLKTPLATAQWYTEMMMDSEIGETNARQKECIKEIYNATQQLIKLTNLLLDASQIELGTFKINFKPVDIITVADSVINKFATKIKEKKLKIKKDYIPKSIIINGDRNIMEIIFQNLISNAIEYTPKGGKVGLFIKKQKPNILIKVSDTGCGIPKAQQSQIFSKFFRADNVKEKRIVGSGLGLYIVKSLLANCKCKIWFESKERKGTTFFVSIPFKKIITPKNNSKCQTQK